MNIYLFFIFSFFFYSNDIWAFRFDISILSVPSNPIQNKSTLTHHFISLVWLCLFRLAVSCEILPRNCNSCKLNMSNRPQLKLCIWFSQWMAKFVVVHCLLFPFKHGLVLNVFSMYIYLHLKEMLSMLPFNTTSF